MRIILDTSALILYFYGNLDVKEVIEDAEEVYVNPINLTEFLYVYTKIKGWKEALFKYTLIKNSFKTINVDDEIVRTSAKLKVKYNISLGDSYLLASAKLLNLIAVTSDHELEKVKEVKVKVIKQKSI
ncbi:MAG: PIN domain-containing protein [Sulfolobaceae archaeon]